MRKMFHLTIGDDNKTFLSILIKFKHSQNDQCHAVYVIQLYVQNAKKVNSTKEYVESSR